MSGPCIGTTLQKNQCSLSHSARNINPPSEVSAPAFRAILWSCCHVAHLLKDAAPRHAQDTSAWWRWCENQPSQVEGTARNLVGAFGLKRAVHSRTGQQRSDQFRCRCYHSFGFFSSFLFLSEPAARCHAFSFSHGQTALWRRAGASVMLRKRPSSKYLFIFTSKLDHPVPIQPAIVWSFSFHHSSHDLSFCSSELIFSRCS